MMTSTSQDLKPLDEAEVKPARKKPEPPSMREMVKGAWVYREVPKSQRQPLAKQLARTP